MNRILSLSFAAAAIGVAVLAAVDIVPTEIAQYGVIALPALAVVSMHSCSNCGLAEGFRS